MAFVSGVVRCLSELKEEKNDRLNKIFDNAAIEEQERQIVCGDLFGTGCHAGPEDSANLETLMQKSAHSSHNATVPHQTRTPFPGSYEGEIINPQVRKHNRKSSRPDDNDFGQLDFNNCGLDDGVESNLLLMCLNMKSEDLTNCPEDLCMPPVTPPKQPKEDSVRNLRQTSLPKAENIIAPKFVTDLTEHNQTMEMSDDNTTDDLRHQISIGREISAKQQQLLTDQKTVAPFTFCQVNHNHRNPTNCIQENGSLSPQKMIVHYNANNKDDSQFLVYEGSLRHGQRHGEGVMRFRNGNEYRGSWRHNKYHGFGVFMFSDGRLIRGMWNMGRRIGNSEMFFPDGRLYNGDYSKESKSGFGTLKLSSGIEIKGIWNLQESPISREREFMATDNNFDSKKRHKGVTAKRKRRATEKTNNDIACLTAKC